MVVAGGTWNGTADTTSLLIAAEGGGNGRTEARRCHNKRYDSFHIGKLGGYNGGRAGLYNSYAQAGNTQYSSTRSLTEGDAPSGLDGSQGVKHRTDEDWCGEEECKGFRPGGAGGSHYGDGSDTSGSWGDANPGDRYSEFSLALFVVTLCATGP